MGRTVLIMAARKSGPPTTQWTEIIEGAETSFLVATFTERIFVVVTQTKRIATMVEAWIDHDAAATKIYDAKVIFGDKSDYNAVYGRALIGELNKLGVTSLLMALSLPEGTETFQAVLSSLREHFE